jgi:hypothetical protein
VTNILRAIGRYLLGERPQYLEEPVPAPADTGMYLSPNDVPIDCGPRPIEVITERAEAIEAETGGLLRGKVRTIVDDCGYYHYLNVTLEQAKGLRECTFLEVRTTRGLWPVQVSTPAPILMEFFGVARNAEDLERVLQVAADSERGKRDFGTLLRYAADAKREMEP